MIRKAKAPVLRLAVLTTLFSACHGQTEKNDIRPYTDVEFAGHKGHALVDTGSSLSSIPRSWFSQGDLRSASKAETRGSVGRYSADVIPIAGLSVSGSQTGQQKAFVTRGLPAVGTAALFSKTSLYLTKNGVVLGVDAAKLCRGRVPITTVFDLDGRFFEDPISAIYLRMKVDNRETDVMLDTGRSNTIVTYGSLADAFSGGLPRLLRVTGSEGQQRSVFARSIDVTLSAGTWRLRVPGTMYDADSPTRARFTLGAGILSYVSIVMAPKKGIGCVIPLRPQERKSD